MTEQSDIDRLMELVMDIYDVAHDCAKGLTTIGADGALQNIAHMCEEEFWRWRDMDEAHQVVRDAAYRDTGIRTVCPKDADLDPMRDEF